MTKITATDDTNAPQRAGAGPGASVATAGRPRVSVERTLWRAFAALAAPLAVAGITAAYLAQRHVDAAAELDAAALPQYVAAQRLSADVSALTSYAQQFLIVSTQAERATLQERIDGRTAGVDRGLRELRRLAGGDSPLQRQLAAASADLTAGVADLAVASEAAARNGETLRILIGRLRGDGAQGGDDAALAGLRELTALAAAAPTPLALRNVIRQFDSAAAAAATAPGAERLTALMRGEDGVAAARRRQLEALQQQRFIVRRQADAGDRIAAAASALAADAEQALDAARTEAVDGAKRLRWLLAAGGGAALGAGLIGLRLLRRRVIARLIALNAVVAASAPASPLEIFPDQGNKPDRRDELDQLAAGVGAMQATIAAQAAALERLRGADPLTGLADRGSFFTAAAAALERLRAAGDAANHPAEGPADGAALALIDIDHFAAVNNMLGASAGDRALQRLAGLLQRRCGDGQLAARIEGDCFAVLLPGATLAEAEIFAMRVRQAAADDRRGTEVESGPPVTVSIGVAPFDAADRSPDDVYRRADAALKRAKRDGRNRVAAFSHHD